MAVVRELVERVAEEIGARCMVEIAESDEQLVVTLHGRRISGS